MEAPRTRYSKHNTAPGRDSLRVTLEPTLSTFIKHAQQHPAVTAEDSPKPSRSLITRRALAVYRDHLSRLTPEDYRQETLECLKLA